MSPKQILTLVFILTTVSLSAQTSIGVELRAYPAGIIPGFRADVQISKNSFITIQTAYNFTNRRDWGKQDEEKGGGPGFGIGYTRSGFFSDRLKLIVRSDFWFMDIGWKDSRTICGTAPPCMDMQVSGSSEITVFQPTIGAEYEIFLSKNLLFKPSLSFGYEINIKTEGEDVGEGAILLAGFSFGYTF